MNRCNNPEVGKLITQYEMGQLSDEERDSFEDHLLDCEFCRQELAEMLPAISTMRERKAEIVKGLHDEGISFESLKEKLLARPRPSGIKKESPEIIWRKIVPGLKVLVRPRVLVPAAVATTALLLLVILPILRQPENPYLNYLSFEKLSYRPQELRGEMATEAERLFQGGMNYYLNNDYRGAIHILKRAVEEAPDNGPWWLYLGVSYYLDGQGKRAIEALTRADALTQYSLKIRARWYLAQAHLLQGSVDSAISLLEWVRNQRREYGGKADSLLTSVRSVTEEKQND